MGRIVVLMGKSSSGKDTIYRELLRDEDLKLHKIVLYTTRPIRSQEKQGREYHFVSDGQIKELEAAGKLVEKRTYHTVHGDWTYATVDDGSLELDTTSYLVIGTLESYVEMIKFYGAEKLLPIYIQVDDGVRLERALQREKALEEPRYLEMCRRFLADAEDFSEEKLAEAGITERFDNSDLETCLSAIKARIRSM